MTKLFASESYKKHSKWFIDMAGSDGLLYLGEEDAPVVALSTNISGMPR